MTPEERIVRQRLLNAWREARRANLIFPHGREMTQEQMDEQRRLEAEQEKARLVLGEFDSADALRDRRYWAQAHVDAGDRAVNRDVSAERDRLLQALRAAQRTSSIGLRGQATTEAEMDELNRNHAEEDKARRELELFDEAHGFGPSAG